MRIKEDISRVAMMAALAGAGLASESSADQIGAKREVTTTSTCPSTGGGLCDGLVGYWKLDEENQDGDLVTTRHDETACGNDMLDQSDDTPPYTGPRGVDVDGMYSGSDRLGVADKATACLPPHQGGNSCYLEVAWNELLDMTDQKFTLAAWLARRGHPVQTGHDVWKGSVGGGYSIHDWFIEIQGQGDGTLSSPHVHFCVSHQFGSPPSLGVHLAAFNPNTPAVDDFFLVVGTYDPAASGGPTVAMTVKWQHPNGGIRTYADSKTDTAFQFLDHDDAGVGIGAKWDSNMRGADEVMLWRDRVLTQSEITQLYTNGTTGNGDPLGGCTP